PRVGHPVGGTHGPAALEDQSAEGPDTWPDANAVVSLVEGVDPVPKDPGPCLGIAEGDTGNVTLAQHPGAIDHLLQDGVDVERGIDGPRDLRHPLGFPPAPPRLLVETGVLEGERGLIGESLAGGDLVTHEGVRLAERHAEHAYRVSPHGEGHGEV